MISAGQVMAGGSVSLTVMSKMQLAAPVALVWTTVTPTGKNAPDAGEKLAVLQPPEVVGGG